MVDRQGRDAFPWIAAFVYAVLFTVLGALRYAVHRNFVDFGIFAQTAAGAFGCFCNQIEGSHWAFHFSPILYVAGALVRLWRSPLALVTLQAVGGALVIPPIYGLVARRAQRPTARLAALVVALYPALAGLTFNDFHENGLAPAAVAWMLWAFDGGWMRATYVFAALALSIKEDQAVFLMIAGALGAWRFRGTAPGRTALVIALAGASLLYGYFGLIQPHAAANQHWSPTRFYAWTPDDLHALPLQLLVRAGFLVLAFAPLLFLPFRSRMMWLAAAPLAEVLLSRMSTTYTLGSHYAGAWIGYALVAFAFTVRREAPPRANRLLVYCLAVCALELAIANPMHPGMNLRPVEARDVALDRFLATLPAGMPVATQEEAYTHLALTHPYAGLLPIDPEVKPDACYVLVDVAYPASVVLIEYGQPFQALVRAGGYRPVRNDGTITLYRAPRCAP
jgi:uncharacterized membrane protein